MTNKELAQQIVSAIGGKKNVQQLTHCVTRLRFILSDATLVDTKKLEQLDGVMGTQMSGGQFQIIIGNKVSKVYNELMLLLDLSTTTQTEQKTKAKGFNLVVETLSSILIPSLPPIIGGGMIKGFLFLFWELNLLEWGSPLFEVLNIMSDCMFYFYPFLLAVSAARRFKVNDYMALALAGVLLYPTIVNGLAEGTQELILWNVFHIPFVDYSSSVIPIVLSVWILSYVYNFFEERIPDLVSIIFTPMLSLMIVVPLELMVLAPLGFYCGEYIAMGVQWLIDLSPIVSGFVIGATRPILVLTGTHHAMRTIVQQQISSYGHSTIGAMNYMSTMAQAAAALGVYLVTKDKKTKELSFSSTISGFLGVTEPALYGVIIKYRLALIATMIGGGIAAAITSYFGSAEYAMVMSSLLTIPATVGEGFIGIVIGLPISIIVTIAIILVGKKSIQKQDKHETEENSAPESQQTIDTNNYTYDLSSPTTGTIVPLSTLADKTFANEIIGKGIGIHSETGKIIAPVSGTVTMLFPTKHAIGITTDSGVECLIHVGIDTTNLEGKFFQTHIQQGSLVKQGDLLLDFDVHAIEQAGFDSTVIFVVTNTQDYLDVLSVKNNGPIMEQDKLLQIIQ